MQTTGAMDPTTGLLLNVAKYGGYAAVLWVTIINRGLVIDARLLAILGILAVDSIRNHSLESSLSPWERPLLWLHLLLAYLFLWLDGTGIGAILFIILIAESQISHSRSVGNRVFLLSLVGFLAIGLLGAWFRGQWSADRISTLLINGIFFFFAFGISVLARLQQEQRERAEGALARLERSQRELESAYAQLMESSRQREELATIAERNRLAREIHDTLAHSLTGIIVGLEAARRLITVDPERSSEELDRIGEQARTGLEEIRRSVRAWRPRELERGDFRSAVRGLAHEMADRGLCIDLDLGEVVPPPHLQLPFYRIIQEGITNSIRHGAAERVEIALRCSPAGITLIVEDDGRGAGEAKEGYGLQVMRERMAEVGGSIEFADIEPHGFRIRAEVVSPTRDHPNPDSR